MRELDTHNVPGGGSPLRITVVDEPGSGGAHHDYLIYATESQDILGHVQFQNGPVAEAGINGVTHEALLAIIIDRLECFQAGPYATNEKALALGKLQGALYQLQQRTRNRLARDVEGTSTI